MVNNPAHFLYAAKKQETKTGTKTIATITETTLKRKLSTYFFQVNGVTAREAPPEVTTRKWIEVGACWLSTLNDF